MERKKDEISEWYVTALLVMGAMLGNVACGIGFVGVALYFGIVYYTDSQQKPLPPNPPK